MLDRKIFDMIHNLQEIQSSTEKNLFIERQRLVEKAKGNEKNEFDQSRKLI